MRKRAVWAGLLFLFIVFLCCTVDKMKRGYTSMEEPVMPSGQEAAEPFGQELHEKMADGFFKYISGLYGYVAVTRASLGGESLMDVIYSRLDDLERRYPDSGIYCTIDVDSPPDSVVDVEIEGEFMHYLYVAQGDVLYEFEGEMMSSLAWEDYLRLLIEKTEEERGEMWLSYKILRYMKDFPGIQDRTRMVILGDFFEISLAEDERIISVKGEEGQRGDTFSLHYREAGTEGDVGIHWVGVHPTAALPDYETEEELRDFFLECYPGAERYEVYPVQEEKSVLYEGRLYVVYEKNAVYGYFRYGGRIYVIAERLSHDRGEEGAGWMGAVRYIQTQLGYEDDPEYVWDADI